MSSALSDEQSSGLVRLFVVKCENASSPCRRWLDITPLSRSPQTLLPTPTRRSPWASVAGRPHLLPL